MNSQGDLTQGRVAPTLLRFALPFLAASALQTLYGIVDLLVVGRFADASAMSAVSISALLTGGITSLVIGLTTGGTVLIGQYLGSGAREDAEKTASTMFTLYAGISVCIAAILFVLARPILTAMNTPEEAFSQALGYVRICACGLVFTVGYNSIAAVLRGGGDSRHPLWFVIVACIFNVIGDLVLVGGFSLGAYGAALATVMGQALSFVAGIIFMRRKGELFDFRLSSFKIHSGKPSRLLRLGIPIALQDSLTMLSFLILESVINNIGVNASAAAGVCDKFFMIGVIPSSAFAQAISAMVAQNMGANKPERVSACLKIGASFSFTVALAMFAWLKINPASAIRIFTSDAGVIEAACVYLHFYAYEYLACSISFPVNGLINGSGHTRFTLINNLSAAFIVRVPLILLFYNLTGDSALYYLSLASTIATSIQLTIALMYFFSGKWKKNNLLESA